MNPRSTLWTAILLSLVLGEASSSPTMISRVAQIRFVTPPSGGAAAFMTRPRTRSVWVANFSNRFVGPAAFDDQQSSSVVSHWNRESSGCGPARRMGVKRSFNRDGGERSSSEVTREPVRHGHPGDVDPSPSPSNQSMLLAGAQIVPFLKSLGAVVTGCAAILLGMLYINQEKLLYIPEIDGIPRNNRDNPPGYRSPAEYGLPFEDNMIKAEDGILIHSWLLLHPQSKQKGLPTIIFFHGNAGNIGIRLPNAQKMYEVLNANILMVEYRGYGDSDDVKPNERGLQLDAEAALRFALSHPSIDPSRIFVFGRSLGGAVGFHVARYAEDNGLGSLAGLIVENTFVSVDRMVDVVLPFLSPLKGPFLRMHFDCGKIAPTLSVPVLYLAGDADEIVPFEHMKELFAKSKKSSILPKMHVVEGGTHNETWLQGGRAYWDQVRKFMSDVLSLG